MVNQPMSPGDPNGKKNRLPSDLKVSGEYKEMLDDLKDYIESRKESLEDEIEGYLHESVRNANDCLERIHETLEPKFKKMVLKKMGEIDVKVNVWTDDCNTRLSEEIKKESAAQTQKVESHLEAKFNDKLQSLAEKLAKTVNMKLESDLLSHLEKVKKRQTIQTVLTVFLLGALGLVTLITKF